MGDLCDANDMLLSPNGDDSNLVTKAERNASDLSRHAYTEHNKMVLRQFEGASVPAKIPLPISSGQTEHLELCTLHSLNDHQGDNI
jgi:hypothetical protein